MVRAVACHVSYESARNAAYPTTIKAIPIGTTMGGTNQDIIANLCGIRSFRVWFLFCFGASDFTLPALAVFTCLFQRAERPLQIWADVIVDRRGRLFAGHRRLPFESLISPLDQLDGRSRCPRR